MLLILQGGFAPRGRGAPGGGRGELDVHAVLKTVRLIVIHRQADSEAARREVVLHSADVAADVEEEGAIRRLPYSFHFCFAKLLPSICFRSLYAMLSA